MKVSGDAPNLAFVPKEHPAGKITDKADSLQGKPGKVSGSIELAAEPHRKNGQNLRVIPHSSEVKNNKVAQLPPGGLTEKADASLVSLLKLPQDGLSRAIIAFARFFSLPLEPKLLAALRREALGARAAGREAAALGAAAAADKGIKLSEQALAEYAAAIEGGNFAPEDAVSANASEQQSAERGSSPQEDSQANDTAEREPGRESENQDAGAGNGNNNRNSSSFRDDGNLQDGGKELQRRITEILEKRQFLDLINRIPGKNGQWIVVPFSFSENGLDFTVSLRILTGKTLVSAHLSADIKVFRLGQEQKRWLVTLERPEENTEASVELSVFSGSVPWHFSAAEKKQVRRELAATLDVPLDKVSIREEALTGEVIPVFTGSRESVLRSVNEEV